jgi:nitroreductase
LLVAVCQRQCRVAGSLELALLGLSAQFTGASMQLLCALGAVPQPAVHHLGEPAVLITQLGPGPNFHASEFSPAPAAAATLPPVDLYEAMRCAPTTRRFKPDTVPQDVLVRVLENARFAPSGGNRQGWRVVVVRDAERRAALRDMYLPGWRAYMEATGGAAVLADPAAFDAATVRRVQRANEYAERLHAVPVHLVVGVRLPDLAVTDAGLPRQSIVGGASVYPFVQNLLLALRAEGLGAALTTLLVPAEAEVKRLLVIPEEVALAAHIGVGYRAEPWPARLSRRPVEEFAFSERWGQPLP